MQHEQTHTHTCTQRDSKQSFVNSLVVARVRAYVTNMRRRHHRVAAAHPLPLLLCCRLFFLFLCCPVRCESKRVAIIVASQAVISPCPCRICRRRSVSPTVSWLAVCSMKLVTSIFVVDVVVVIGLRDCAGARPNHLLLPSSSSPCCSTPLCGLPSCRRACALCQCIPLVVGQFTSSYWAHDTAQHSTAEGTRQSLERETCRGVAQLSSLSCLLSNPQPAQLSSRVDFCATNCVLKPAFCSARLSLHD